jgi:hypothetical protein
MQQGSAGVAVAPVAAAPVSVAAPAVAAPSAGDDAMLFGEADVTSPVPAPAVAPVADAADPEPDFI